jgi:hypothetical protein
MARAVFVASFVLKACSTLCFFLAWWTYRPASRAAVVAAAKDSEWGSDANLGVEVDESREGDGTDV